MYNYRRFTTERESKERLLQLYADYMSMKSLARVGDRHGISKERVRQLLKAGSDYGLFEYPWNPLASLAPEQFEKDYVAHGSIRELKRHYNIGRPRIEKYISKHNISLAKLRIERSKARLLREYEQLVQELGRHPTVTGMRSHEKFVSLHNKILRHFGSIVNFRKAHAISMPPKDYTAFIRNKKNQYNAHRAMIFAYLTAHPEITLFEIADSLGLSRESVRKHLRSMSRERLIQSHVKRHKRLYSVKTPKKTVQKHPSQTQLGASQLNLNRRNLIDTFARLYAIHGSIKAVSKEMGQSKKWLLRRIDRIISENGLSPIKNRRTLLLCIRIKNHYQMTKNMKRTASAFGVTNFVVSRYLRYCKKAGLLPMADMRDINAASGPTAAPEKDLYGKDSLARMRKLHSEYEKTGSLKEVAKLHNVSYETIRQILIAGNDIGLYEFPHKKPALFYRVSKEKLHKDLLKYGSAAQLCKHYKTSLSDVKNALRRYGISIPAVNLELSRIKALQTYEEIVNKVGHHPSTPEIKKIHGYLLRRIEKIWGSIYNFRKCYGFPDPRAKE